MVRLWDVLILTEWSKKLTPEVVWYALQLHCVLDCVQFLCICREFLDKVQSEIDRKPDTADHSAVTSVDVGDDVIKHLFQGELISEVTS